MQKEDSQTHPGISKPLISSLRKSVSTEQSIFFVINLFLETSFDLVINRHTAIHLGLMDNIKVSSSFVIHI